MIKNIVLMAPLLSLGCAYHFGFGSRSLPGGYREVSVPVFTNETMEVGIETDFTNALIRHIEKSHVAKVVQKDLAPVTIHGTINEIEYVASAPITPDSSNKLPKNTAFFREYRIILSMSLAIIKKSNGQVLWKSKFSDEKVYQAPRLTLPLLNSANPLYNQSARQQNISLMAEDMMEEAFDRMTENF